MQPRAFVIQFLMSGSRHHSWSTIATVLLVLFIHNLKKKFYRNKGLIEFQKTSAILLSGFSD